MKKKVAIIGGGTAGLFLAAFLDTDLFDVTIFEKKKTLGRKFLVAGEGGFNLTHSEHIEKLKLRYTPNTFLEKALEKFTNEDLRNWLDTIGIPTFVGSSKRVFPTKGIKPIQVLKAIETYLLDKNVKFELNKTFTGWNVQNELLFNTNEIVNADFVVFALGGGSWKVTGSEGDWLSLFADKGIKTLPFQASNCAFGVEWSKEFIKKHEGKPLKNIAISIGNQNQKGEAVITKFGLEGGAIYALSPKIQTALALETATLVYIDFKPMLSYDTLVKKINNSRHKRTETLKRVLKLSTTQIDLIKGYLSKEDFLDDAILINTIKKFPLEIKNAAPINEAISTAGGIDRSAIDENFELINLKNHFTIGEMIDWNAPTGGYLIQGCASMGVCLANRLNETYK